MKNAFNFENSYRRRSCQSIFFLSPPFVYSYLAVHTHKTYNLIKRENPLNAYALSQTITQNEMDSNEMHTKYGVAFVPT